MNKRELEKKYMNRIEELEFENDELRDKLLKTQSENIGHIRLAREKGGRIEELEITLDVLRRRIEQLLDHMQKIQMPVPLWTALTLEEALGRARKTLGIKEE